MKVKLRVTLTAEADVDPEDFKDDTAGESEPLPTNDEVIQAIKDDFHNDWRDQSNNYELEVETIEVEEVK